MTPSEELFALVGELKALAEPESFELAKPVMNTLVRVAEEVGKSASGSWLGYHANVYYDGLVPPPSNAHFDPDWGLRFGYQSFGSRGQWVEVDRDKLIDHIKELAGNPDLTEVKLAATKAGRGMEKAKAEVLSILGVSVSSDSYIDDLSKNIAAVDVHTKREILNAWLPKGSKITRDTAAISQGIQAPPHLEVKADVFSINSSFQACDQLAELCRQAASHLERKGKARQREDRVGTNVFIGHGRSPLWRELKDFVQDRLKLPADEFNRVPVAGLTNIARLSEMLDAAALALVVMTAEDENAEGEMQARMNVIHEVGLFQGRLGFTKAIVVLEEGCKEFSNIQGLGQVRFPKGNIKACFEEIRQVAEREGLVTGS